jgi:outer membrane lipopolysaccharide assembly protein LptE/RlpB
MKKIIILLVISLVAACGFKPVNNITNFNFQLINIEIAGDKIVNRYLRQNLNRFSKNTNANKFYKVIIYSDKQRKTTSKNSAGEPSSYQLQLSVILTIFENDKKLIEEDFKKTSNYNNLNSKFELRQLENILTKDLTKQINLEINNLLFNIE